jgi:hypothetical protein
LNVTRRAAAGVRVALLALAALSAWPAEAVVTYFNGSGQRSITLRVGSNNTTVNTVTFDVTGANVAPSPTAVTGVPGGGAPVTSPTGGIEIEMTVNRRGNNGETVRLLANSTAGMACTGGGCGSTSVPFTTVSWTSHNLEAGAGKVGLDIQSGTFSGSAAQQLVSLTVPATYGGNSVDSVIVRNVLIFTYANSTLYPSGNYSGIVTFTATVP